VITLKRSYDQYCGYFSSPTVASEGPGSPTEESVSPRRTRKSTTARQALGTRESSLPLHHEGSRSHTGVTGRAFRAGENSYIETFLLIGKSRLIII